jgi:hypothetical protein
MIADIFVEVRAEEIRLDARFALRIALDPVGVIGRGNGRLRSSGHNGSDKKGKNIPVKFKM